MTNIYIDESGSMCENPLNKYNNFFFISLVKVNDPARTMRRYKRFIRKNFNELKKADRENRMFENGNFKELKGSAMTFQLKTAFIKYMCIDNLIEVYLIKIDNNAVYKGFFDNTARAFNFVLKLNLERYAWDKLLTDKELFLHLDNRSVRTNTVHLLKEYLNTELVTGLGLYNNIEAQYYQSENCKFVQIADVFANAHYSTQFNSDYKLLFDQLEREGYIKNNFTFPKESAKKLKKITEQKKKVIG